MLAQVRAVLFDAVGTLMRPEPPVAVAYQTVARRFGSQLSQQEVARRFAIAFNEQEEADRRVHDDAEAGANAADSAPLARRATDEQRERRRWQRIVADVFHEVDDAGGQLFDALWNHFAQSRHWALYDDVAGAWRDLERRGLTIGIASNFDERLVNICREMEPLAGCRHIFWSAGIGFPKPSPEFFRAVAQRLALPPEQILLVGDSRVNDFLGAQAAGWHALLVDRASENANDGIISSLEALTRLLAT
jgi:putative hydrolase of the HAD superfamily